jgi:class 3 adenylate cyclase/HAMP domain-containing protein
LADDGSVAMATQPVSISSGEQEELARIASSGERGLITPTIAGVERVARGFPFPPFGWYLMVTEQRGVFYSDVNNITRYTGAILVVACGLSVLLLMAFATRLTSPLTRVAATMETIITENDLTARVPVEYRDETGKLAHTFNIMVGELQKAYDQIKRYAFQAVLAQKREHKVRNIFQKYVPQDLIDRFFQNPEAMLVGDNRELAILFSDIRSFTTISEGMKPDDLVNSLNRYFDGQVDIIMNRNGIVDKYIGDAIMAFFGAPVAHDDDPLQAILAGIEMAEAVELFNVRQKELDKPEFKIGVGIAYGEVTVGNIGTEKKMDYTVIGDMVNLASRLEGLTKMYKQPLLVSDTLWEPVKDHVRWRLIDTVAVKGRTKGARIYTAAKSLDEAHERGWSLHNEAMGRYYDRVFPEAVSMFEEVKSILPGDHAATIMADRCRLYAESPPPEDWDGVEIMTTK